MKKYSLDLYLYNLGKKFCLCLKARKFKIFSTIVRWFTKDSKQRTSLNSSNILGIIKVWQRQEFVRNKIFRNRRQVVNCFDSVDQFSDTKFLLHPMFHTQELSLQKKISDGVYFSKVTSLHCNMVIRKETTKRNFLFVWIWLYRLQTCQVWFM